MVYDTETLRVLHEIPEDKSEQCYLTICKEMDDREYKDDHPIIYNIISLIKKLFNR